MLTRSPHGAKRIRAVRPRALALIEWQQIAKDLENPDLELDIETFAKVLSGFVRAQDAGKKFDPAFVALVTLLARQATGTDDDADHDLSDQWLDHDDSDGDVGPPVSPKFLASARERIAAKYAEGGAQ